MCSRFILVAFLAIFISPQQPVGAGWIPSSWSAFNPFGWPSWWSSSNSTNVNQTIASRSDDSTNVIIEPIVDRSDDRQNGIQGNIAFTTTTTVAPANESSPSIPTVRPFEPGSIKKMFTTTTARPRTIGKDTSRIKLNKKGRMYDFPFNPVALNSNSSQLITSNIDLEEDKQRIIDTIDKRSESTVDRPASSRDTSVPANVTATPAPSSRRWTSFLSGWWSRNNSKKAPASS